MGTGKTTFALWQAYNFAKGINILDRDTPCKKGKTLFICTDGGVNTFKKAMADLCISEDDPVMSGHNQRIFVWGYDPNQTDKKTQSSRLIEGSYLKALTFRHWSMT